MVNQAFIVFLLTFLAVGVYRRWQVEMAHLNPLSPSDKLRDILGFAMSVALCMGAIWVFSIYPKPLTAFLSFTIILTYHLTAPKSFQSQP